MYCRGLKNFISYNCSSNQSLLFPAGRLSPFIYGRQGLALPSFATTKEFGWCCNGHKVVIHMLQPETYAFDCILSLGPSSGYLSSTNLNFTLKLTAMPNNIPIPPYSSIPPKCFYRRGSDV
ncbi:unnamed protein product [Ixodes persulcatus]